MNPGITRGITCPQGHDEWKRRTGKNWHECLECRRVKARTRYGATNPLGPRRRSQALWEDGNAEWLFLREQGLTVAQIAAKLGVTTGALERALYRNVGPKDQW